MCRDEALRALDSVVVVEALRKRAKALMEHPELLNQGEFGICSSMVVLYAAMVHRPMLVIGYLEGTVFGGQSFRVHELLEHYERKKSVKLEKRKAEVAAYFELLSGRGGLGEEAIERASKYLLGAHDNALDYVMGRLMMEILGADRETGRALYEESKRWSERYFASATWAIEQGDFAVKTRGVQFMVKRVFDVDTRLVDGATFGERVVAVNELVRRESKPFVFVAINGFSDLAKDSREGRVTSTAFVRDPRKAEYTHWVAFTREIEVEGSDYVFHFFSWGRIFETRIDQGVAGSYMVDLVAGAFS